MYKLASATRADTPAMDLMGLWFQPSSWLCVCVFVCVCVRIY